MGIVKAKNLVKRYGEILAVNHVDLDIDEGEIYGLLGPNGAGKTTITNILCDLVGKDSGELWIMNKKVDQSFAQVKSQIGVVPQNVALYEDLTAQENVMFFASLYGLKRQVLRSRTMEALEFVSLVEVKNRMVKTFSGGMKRRLNIACAIAHRPQLIIMDEPTVGIDPQSRSHILNSVKKLNKLGSTVIYTTHYMEEVEQICTRIGILDHGKVIAEGTSSELQSIVTDRKIIIIKTGIGIGIDSQDLKSIKGVITVTIQDNNIRIECPKESDCISRVLNYFVQRNIIIHDIKMEGVSLETAFLSLTGRRLRD